MNRIIRIDRGIFYIDGKALPGVISSLSIGGKMILDQAQAEGMSGKKKSFSGFDDSAISIGLTLFEVQDGGISRYDKLKNINNAFKTLENNAPIVYSIQGALFDSADIRHVLFTALDVDEPSDTDAINISIKFVEHDPAVALVQSQQSDTGNGGQEIVEPENPLDLMTPEEGSKFQALEAEYE